VRTVPWLRWIIVLAVVARLGLAWHQGLDRPTVPGSDEAEYDAYAWNLAQGNGYRGPSPDVSDPDHLTAYRPPGPSLMYAALYAVGGHHPALPRLANILLSALTCLLIAALGRRVVHERIALAAAALWAVWPVSILLSVDLLSESLSVACFFWLLLALLDFADRPRWREALLAGLALGINLLVHPSRLFFVPMMGLWVLMQFWRTPAVLVRAAAMPLVALACLVPWIARNQRVFGEFIPFSTMGGSVLLQGNNRIVATDPEYWGYNIWDTEIPEYADRLRAPDDEIERDRVAKQLAKEWMGENARLLPVMAVKKVVRGWTPFLQARTPLATRLAMLLTWGPVLLFTLVGIGPALIAYLRRRHPGTLLHFAILHVLALNVVFFGYFRYRLAVEPLCFLLAGFGIAWLAARLGGPRWLADAATIPDPANH